MQNREIFSSASSIASRNREIREPIQVECLNAVYEVEESIFKSNLNNISLNCLLSFTIILLASSMLITDKVNPHLFINDTSINLNWLIPFLISACMSLAFVLFIAYNQMPQKSIAISSSLLLAIYLIVAIFLYCYDKPFQWVIVLIASLIELFLAFILLEKKIKLLFIILAIIQMFLIALKIDHRLVDVPWYLILIPLALASFMFIFFFLFLFFFYLIFKWKAERILPLFFTELNQCFFTLGYFLLSFTIICRILLESVAFPLEIVTIVIFTAYIPFQIHFKQQIALGLSHAHLIVYVEVQSINSSAFDKIPTNKTIYRISNDFLSFDKNDPRRTKDLLIKLKRGKEQCVICLSELTSMVWMPCGHLAVCQACDKFLRESYKFQCVICKTECQSIYHIAQQQKLPYGKTKFKTDYYYKIR